MNNLLKKYLKFFLFSVIIAILVKITTDYFFKKEKKLINERIDFIFLKKFDQKELQKLFKNINNNDFDFKELENYLKVFRIGFNKKEKLLIENIQSSLFSQQKQKIKENLENIFQKEKFYFYYKNDIPIDKKGNILEIKNFFSIKVGSNFDYFKEKYFNKETFLKIGILDNFVVKDVDKNQELKIYETKESLDTISQEKYNNLIREKKSSANINSFFLKSNLYAASFEVFVDDTGDLPIQWPFKLKWYSLLFWGYIWNVLLILIGSLLYFFTYLFFSAEGVFFGNLGFGIILTTVLIRTLLWPIYTKTSTFSLNMSMAQPEINKIQQKYALKKDPDSIKKMQLEIFKVYKKHNFSIFDILLPFLQMPIFIAMLRTLNRIRVEGGIFSINTEKPFLNFIYFNRYNYPKYYFLTKLFLSFLVGLSMFFLNKINFKKNPYTKINDKILTLEQINKNKSQEKNMKIVSYIMIFLMMITSFQDSCLSLYWIVGNIYTLCQTIINRKFIDKKYVLLKNINKS
ncbi:YidC/Oxa1 family membrane protein insertase [Candidatus Phytoplasma sacchari]|uniref:Membrane protein insertase YidC n=1 Tax=Candidatus Phytoplasma sacchari TaxID=2609813 RepID=A0ABY7M0Y0_9MOLU|nr:membrane protein insertase YidC [Candidatus Phytoplasma sacchari]